MVDRRLRHQLLQKLRSSKQALSQRATRLKRKYGPMSTDDAVYVIAHLHGIDLSEYLSPTDYDRIRSLVPRKTSNFATVEQQARAKPPKKKRLASYPLVSDTIARAGVDLGSSTFPLIFVLENSIRNLIEKRLSRLGADWWDKYVPADVQKNVQRTIDREKMHPYREHRGTHPLLYTNFADLKKIIVEVNNRPCFNDVIKDFDLFRGKMDEVYMARNNLAHSVPLAPSDISRIKLFYEDWARQLDVAGER